jgi:hypothetical protein
MSLNEGFPYRGASYILLYFCVAHPCLLLIVERIQRRCLLLRNEFTTVMNVDSVGFSVLNTLFWHIERQLDPGNATVQLPSHLGWASCAC